jgi:hypothetical protein
MCFRHPNYVLSSVCLTGGNGSTGGRGGAHSSLGSYRVTAGLPGSLFRGGDGGNITNAGVQDVSSAQGAYGTVGGVGGIGNDPGGGENI